MTESINCGYARVAARHFTTNHYKGNKLPHGSYPKIMAEFNQHFSTMPSFKVDYTTTIKKFPAICRRFNMKWTPKSARKDYLEVFSIGAWNQLSTEDKQKHTITNCTECSKNMPNIFNSFPSARKQDTVPAINFSTQDLSNAKRFGKKVLRELNVLTNTHFSQPIQEVLVKTPKSKLEHRKDSATRQKEVRSIENKVKKDFENEMVGQDAVLQNRLSWRQYDKIRQTTALTTTPKRSRDDEDEIPPAKRKRHGSNLTIDQDKLLDEARSWPMDYEPNWSALGTEYGLSSSNRGQCIKEFLSENGISAALRAQRQQRALRRSKKKFRGKRLSMPMPPPANKERKKLQERIENGEFTLGNRVVEQEYTTYKVTPDSNLIATTTKYFARKISIKDIREKLLSKHEALGVIRANDDLSNLTRSQLEHKLIQLGEKVNNELCDEDLRERLQSLTRRRHLKIWHDHSNVAGHSYLLVLVTPIYDEAFYYIPAEVEQKLGVKLDVQAIVEHPEVHIIGRSSSSIADQMLFNKCRQECLRKIDEPIQTQSGIHIHDIVRFFHGDGPAQQYECGHKLGGTYKCVQCGAKSA